MLRVLPPLILAAVVLSPLAAQNAVPAKLSLKDAVSMALNVNSGLKQAQESKLSSQSRLRVAQFATSFSIGAYSAMERSPVSLPDSVTGLPFLSHQSIVSQNVLGSLDFAGLLGTKASLSLTPFGIGSQRGGVGLSITHPLLQGTGRLSDKYNAIQSALTDASIQNLDYSQTQQSTIANVVDAYYRAVQARDQVKLREEAVTNAQLVADGTKEKVNEGVVAGIEVSRADIQVSQTRESLNQQIASARAAMDYLMIAIGSGIGQNPDLTDSAPDLSTDLPTLDDAIKTALVNRTEMSVYQQRITDQERKLALAKDRLRSSLNAFADISSQNQNTGLLDSTLVDQGNLKLGLRYSFPLDKRIIQEDRDTAIRGLDVLKSSRAYQSDQIVQEVRNAYRSVETQRNSINIFTRNITESQKSLELAQLALDEGISDNRNLLDAQVALTQAQSGLLSAKIDLYLASVHLKYAMGEDLTKMGLR